MNSWKKIALTATAVLGTAVALTGCGSKSDSSTSSDGTTVITMYQIGDKPKNYTTLMKTANKEIKSKLNLKLEIKYIGWGDYDKKYSTMVSSGDPYDIAYVRNYAVNARKGAFADLTKLMPKYAKTAYNDLDEAYIKGNTIGGKLYAFPVNANVYGQSMLTFNSTLLKKYNLDISKINTYQDVEPLLAVIKKNEKTVVPYAVGQGYKIESNFDYILGNGMPFAVDVADGANGKKIVNQYDTDRMQKNLTTMHEYYEKGYIPTDAATTSTDYPMSGNTWFVRQETQGPYDYGDTILTNAAGKKLESRGVTVKLKSAAQTQVANFAISKSSKHINESVKLLGLLNSDAKLLNGLVWGEEGKAWEKTGTDKIKLLDGYKPGYYMSAWNLANNKILYTQDSVTADMIKERDQSIKDATSSPLLGFDFDQTDVKAEVSNITNVMAKYLDSLNTGTVEPKETIKKMDAELKVAGMDKVMKEMQKQYNAFLAKN